MPSLLGAGLPERLRSTLVALFGLTAAAGLAMVAFVLQQGFPLVASGPIPDPAVVREAVHDRIVVQGSGSPSRRQATPPRTSAADVAPTPAPVADDVVQAAPTPSEDDAGLVTGSAPSDEKKVPKRPAARPPVSPPPAAQVPAATPPAEPDATSSELAPPVTEPEPDPSHPGNGNAYGKGKGKGVGNGGIPPGHATGAEPGE